MEFHSDIAYDFLNENECMPDNSMLKLTQSESELNQLSTPTDLNSAEKAMLFLKSGFAKQKVWVVRNIDSILQDGGETVLESILVTSKQKTLMSFTEELKRESGMGLKVALQKGLVPASLFEEVLAVTLTFLSYYSQSLHDHWLPVLEELLPQCPTKLYLSKAVPEIVLLSEPTQKDIVKVMVGKVLALSAYKLKKEFGEVLLQKTKVLSKDPNSRVRLAMCQAWKALIRSGGDFETCFLEVVGLLKDEDSFVRKKALGLFVDLLERMPDTLLQYKVISVLYKEVFGELKLETGKHFGKLLTVAAKHLKPEKCYQILNELKETGTETRLYLAKDLSLILGYFGFTKSSRDFLNWICQSEDFELKKEVVKSFPKLPGSVVKSKVFYKYSQEFIEDSELSLVIIDNLSSWAKLIDPSQLLMKVIAQLISQSNWRIQYKILQKLEDSLELFVLKEVLDHLVSLLINKVLTSYWKIKEKSAELLAYIVYKTHYISRKIDICNILKEKLANSTNCSDRVMFLHFTLGICNYHSIEFFTKHFSSEVLQLAHDAAHSVRLRLATDLVPIRRALDFAAEPQFLEVLEILCEDKYPSIREAAAEASFLINSREFEYELHSAEREAEELARTEIEKLQAEQEIKEKQETQRRLAEELAAKACAQRKTMVPRRSTFRTRTNLSIALSPKLRETRSIPSMSKKK